jgi:hypothetical protein
VDSIPYLGVFISICISLSEATSDGYPYHLSSLMKQMGSIHVSIFFNGIDIFDHALCSVIASGGSKSLLEGLLKTSRFILLATGEGVPMNLDST